MKQTALALIITALAGSSAYAQSGLTIYGIVDTSMRYLSSDNAAGQRNLSMENGAISNSRIGFKGSEDIGGGATLSFRLENGFNADNGSMSAPGSLFNRQSWLAIDNSSFGRFGLGRQNTPLFDLIANHFDPLTVGNYAGTAWLPAAATLVRNGNMLKYHVSAGGLGAAVSYAMGEQAGSLRSGSQFSSALRYSVAGLTFGAGWQQTVSTSNSSWKDTAYSLALAYELGSVKLMGGYYRIKDSTGTTTATMAGNHSLAEAGGMPGVARRDDAYFAGIRYQLTPAWSLAMAAYFDRSRQVSVADVGIVGDGRRSTLVTLAEYALSKRTQLYGTVDYNRASAAARIELPSGDRQTGVAVGIRHIF